MIFSCFPYSVFRFFWFFWILYFFLFFVLSVITSYLLFLRVGAPCLWDFFRSYGDYYFIWCASVFVFVFFCFFFLFLGFMMLKFLCLFLKLNIVLVFVAFTVCNYCGLFCRCFSLL